MKLRSMMVAALAVATMASCSKDSENGGNDTVTGDPARLGVTLTMPVQTRAWDNDVNATAAESEINTVTVYVFNAGNGSAVSDGAHTNFVKADFTDNSGTWTLNAAKNIKTVSGNVKVYVAVNLPASKAIAYATESAMLDAFDALASIDNSNNTTGFTMFSEVVPITLAAYDENDPSTIGKASANLDRVVSKLVASTASASYTQKWPTADVTFEYTIKGLGVYNEAVESYLAKNTTTKSTINSFTTSAQKTNAAVILHPSGETATSALTGFYICENQQGSGNATYGKSTYAMISTTVTVDKEGEWDNTADGGNGDVVYTSVTPYGGGTDDIFIVTYQGVSYVTNSLTKAQAIATGLEGKHSLTTGALDDNIYKYGKGYVHFMSYLNREGSNDYNIGRNEFIHAKINGITIGDGAFPGYPGEDGDEDKPINPTDKNDPKNPDPKDPDDNIDPDAAVLNIDIKINKWNYRANEIILQ